MNFIQGYCLLVINYSVELSCYVENNTCDLSEEK